MLFRCYRDGAEYISCLVECDQLTEGFEVVEPAPVTVGLFVVLQHSGHVQAFAEDVIDEGLICEPCIHQDIAGLYPGFQNVADHCHGGIRLMADRFLAALIAAFAPVDSGRGPHDMLPGIRGCHHVERKPGEKGGQRTRGIKRRLKSGKELKILAAESQSDVNYIMHGASWITTVGNMKSRYGEPRRRAGSWTGRGSGSTPMRGK